MDRRQFNGGTPPERTREQRLRALEQANEARSAKARLRARLHANEIHAGKLLTEPAYVRDVLPPEQEAVLVKLPIREFLVHTRGIGKVKAASLLPRAKIEPTRRIGRLTPGERRRLTVTLEETTAWRRWDEAA